MTAQFQTECFNYVEWLHVQNKLLILFIPFGPPRVGIHLLTLSIVAGGLVMYVLNCMLF